MISWTLAARNRKYLKFASKICYKSRKFVAKNGGDTKQKVKVVLRVDTNDSNRKKKGNGTDQRWKENMVLHLIVPSPLGFGSEQHSGKS